MFHFLLTAFNFEYFLVLEGNDFVQNISIDTDGQQRLIIWKVREKCLLICLFDATIPSDEYSDNIEEELELIEQSKNFFI